MNQQEAIAILQEIHPDYDFSKFEYHGAASKKRTIVTCPHHGEFSRSYQSLRSGKGCPQCESVSKPQPAGFMIRTRPEIRNLALCFSELTGFEISQLFESLLYQGIKRFIDDRSRELDIDLDVLEALEAGLDDCFTPVRYKNNYVPIGKVPENERTREQRRNKMR